MVRILFLSLNPTSSRPSSQVDIATALSSSLFLPSTFSSFASSNPPAQMLSLFDGLVLFVDDEVGEVRSSPSFYELQSASGRLTRRRFRLFFSSLALPVQDRAAGVVRALWRESNVRSLSASYTRYGKLYSRGLPELIRRLAVLDSATGSPSLLSSTSVITLLFMLHT